MAKKGLLLFSGGIDSTLSALLLRETTELVALSISYPGRPEGERKAVDKLSKVLDFSDFLEINIDTCFKCAEQGTTPGWIPYRNLLIWGVAAHTAIKIGAGFVAAGHTLEDGVLYSDASDAFFERLNAILDYTGDSGVSKVEIMLPLTFEETPEEPVLLAMYENTLARTWSCWIDGPTHCGNCYACQERTEFFRNKELTSGVSTTLETT